MDIEDIWRKAMSKTEVIRPRIKPLETFGLTHLPYIFLAESSLNKGDTIVRKGEVVVDKPNLVLPSNLPKFEGFEFDDGFDKAEDYLMNFFLLRGIHFPSLKYENKTDTLDLREGSLQKAIDSYKADLQKKENISTGLVIGPEECWQFSILIFICSQVVKSAEGDIKKLLDRFRKEEG